jgi:hypothetical protein
MWIARSYWKSSDTKSILENAIKVRFILSRRRRINEDDSALTAQTGWSGIVMGIRERRKKLQG